MGHDEWGPNNKRTRLFTSPFESVCRSDVFDPDRFRLVRDDERERDDERSRGGSRELDRSRFTGSREEDLRREAPALVLEGGGSDSPLYVIPLPLRPDADADDARLVADVDFRTGLAPPPSPPPPRPLEEDRCSLEEDDEDRRPSVEDDLAGGAPPAPELLDRPRTMFDSFSIELDLLSSGARPLCRFSVETARAGPWGG